MFGYTLFIVKNKKLDEKIVQIKMSGFKSKTWTPDDELTGASMLKSGSTKKEVALELGRTTAAIYSRSTAWRKKGLL